MKYLMHCLMVTVLAGLYSSVFAGEAVSYTIPKKIPAGTITEIRLSTKEDLALEWDVPKFKEEPTLEAGQKFAEVFVTIASGRSCGKSDYSLSGAPCLAMAQGEGKYNPLHREYKAAAGNNVLVKLLFLVKEAEAPFSLTFNYIDDTSIKYDPDLTVVSLQMKDPNAVVPMEVKPVDNGDGAGDDDDADVPAKKKAPKKRKPAAKKKPKSRVPANEGW